MFSRQQDNMEAAALRFRLLSVFVSLLLAVVWNYAQKGDAAFPRIDPNRLQFFEYESISVNCEELDLSSEWRVMRKQKDDPTSITTWETSTGSITLNLTFTSDSGEYWCENKGGGRSNITFTAGSVILDSPAIPVMEGDDVNLDCRHKTQDRVPADFYKDGLLSGTGYEGIFSIHSVSKSDEGLYKCSISGGEESAESWLAVRARITSSHEDILHVTSETNTSSYSAILLPLISTISCVAVLLVLVGILHHQKHAVPGEASVAVMSVVTYAVVTKETGDKTEPGVSSCSPRQTSSACTKRYFRGNSAVRPPT